MLGSEGEGLRWTLQKKADYVLGVQGARLGQGGVDSLNVSVAAGLLCEAFMKPPSTSQPAYKEIRENEDVTSNVTVDAAHSSSHDETRGGYVKPTMGAQLGKGEDGEKNENVLF